RFKNTKTARNGNSRFVRCSLEDFTGEVECVMWPDDFVRHKNDFKEDEDRVCFVKGSVEHIREKPSLVLTRILTVEQAQRELTKGLMLSLTLGRHEPAQIDAIARVLERTPGNCPVYLLVRDVMGKRSLLKTGEDFRINPGSVSTADLETILGEGCVRFTGPANGNGRNGK